MRKMSKLKALLVTTALASIYSVNASADGFNMDSSSYVLYEAGFSYTHAIYKSSVKNPESYTVVNPNGVSMDPQDFYPSNFIGGYIGVSLLKNSMLYNVRYDMFASNSKKNSVADTDVSLSPAKLSLTVDKLLGNINCFSYGAGAGIVISTTNNGKIFSNSTNTIPSTGQIIDPVHGESLQGYTRIDPVIEAVAMYHLTDNINLRLNIAYQIPVNASLTNGSINTNLGINYALPV